MPADKGQRGETPSRQWEPPCQGITVGVTAALQTVEKDEEAEEVGHVPQHPEDVHCDRRFPQT